MSISSEQVRAARALLGWSQADLANASGLSHMTIKNLERHASPGRRKTLEAIRSALEQAGATFVSGDADNVGGVKLSRQ